MKKVKLGSLLKVEHGYPFKSENYVDDSNVALVTLANFTETNNFAFNSKKTTFYGSNYPAEFNLEEGDLIAPLTEQVIGLFGNTAFVPKIEGLQFVLNQRVGKITVKNNVDKYYIHFLLSTNLVRDQLEARASAGTKQRNISPTDIYDVTVKIPEYNQQVKIGSCLYSIERMINNNDKINQEIENIINLTYEHWFYRFDFPNDNEKPYKSSGGIMVWNNDLKRDIPKGWKVKSLKSNPITKIIKPGIEEFSTKNYLATKNVNETEISDGENILFKSRPNRANMSPRYNSVWFAKMKNSIKHFSVTKSDKWFIDKYILSTGFLGLECNENSFSYIRAFIYSNYFETVKNKLAHGATQEAINNNDLKYVKLLIPDEKTLKKFNLIIYPLIEIINNNIKKNKELKKLELFLLPIFMNGQARIR